MSALPDCTCEQSIAHCARHGIQRELTAAPTSARRKSRKPPRARSIKQEVDDAFWAGMKAMAAHLLGPEALCGICEKPLGLGVIDADHIIPKGRGGESVPENLQLVHRSCHEETKHRNVPEWSKS